MRQGEERGKKRNGLSKKLRVIVTQSCIRDKVYKDFPYLRDFLLLKNILFF